MSSLPKGRFYNQLLSFYKFHESCSSLENRIFSQKFAVKTYIYSHWVIFKAWIMNESTVSSGVDKRWSLRFFFTTHHIDFWGPKNTVVSVDVWGMAFSRGGSMCCFYRFFERQPSRKWLCTTHNILFYVVRVVRLRPVQSFQKKDTIC